MGFASEPVSIIDQGITIEGKVSCKGMLIIKGTVKGSLLGETIIIAEEGRVYANAETERMTIGGLFQGDIRASSELVLLSTGSCAGKVICENFIVKAGGILNAQVSSITVPDRS